MYREIAIYIGDSRVDLFPDETISLTRSAQSLKDLTKVFTDFTKSFKVPANDNNNAIFKHYYDANVTNGFDARRKVAGRIEIGGVTFQKGQFQLNGAMLKGNVVQNYDLQFFGDTIKIKDLIGDDTLKDLDFSEFNHDYTPTVVQSGLTIGLFSEKIKYPLLSYDRRYLWQSVEISDDENVNIKYDSSFTQGLDWQELKPAIKVSEIWGKIQQTYGFNFTNNFTNRQEFRDLYMSLGNGKQENDYYSTTSIHTFQTTLFPRVNSQPFFRPLFEMNVTPTTTSSQGVEYRGVFYVNGEVYHKTDWVTGINNLFFGSGANYTDYNIVYSFEWVIEVRGVLSATIETRLVELTFSASNVIPLDSSIQTLTLAAPKVDINNLMPKIKVIDFIAAILKSFNLVMQPTDNEDIYLNDLNTWYSSGNIFDISQYVDVSTLQVERGKLFKEVNMGYEQNDSFLAQEYRSNFNIDFGAIENKIDGVISTETLDIKLPFSNPQFERLTNSPIQYGYIVDKDREQYENLPFLFYCPNLNLGTDQRIGFNSDNYVPLSSANMPSHSVFLQGGFAFQFNAEISEYNGGLLDRNIYSVFWSDYINDIFSTQRRQFTINAYLPITLSNDLKLNDRLIIKGNRYVIDNLEVNLLTGVTKLVLLNDIFTSLNVGDISKTGQVIGTFDVNGGSIPYTGADLAYVSTSAEWINLSENIVSNGNNIEFTLEQNPKETRAATIQIQDNLGNPTIIVIQE